MYIDRFVASSAQIMILQGDEQLMSDYLLKIFRSCVPSMPKSAIKFAGSLQDTLLTMINKPAVGALVRLSRLLRVAQSLKQLLKYSRRSKTEWRASVRS
jgi:hypothetical protein